MAKNKNKKKRNGAVSMDVSEPTFSDRPEAMDTSETGGAKPAADAFRINTKKGRPMKRAKNVRKVKAVAKAVSMNEKYAEKVSKSETKALRTLSVKKLYD